MRSKLKALFVTKWGPDVDSSLRRSIQQTAASTSTITITITGSTAQPLESNFKFIS